VFGFPIEHSLSPAMHNAAFAALQLSYIYVPFAVRPGSIGPAIRSLEPLGIVGVNLTIPHKQSVLPFLDEITPEAREVGAVNTVHCLEGRLLGDNTDGRGFFEPLREMGVTVAGACSVVLGSGGAARSVAFRLAREGARVTLVNRTEERARKLAADVALALPASPPVTYLPMDASEALAEAISHSTLLVQTTRVGMFPEQDAVPPVPAEALHPRLLVYDLIYNPVETGLLKLARERGCRTLTGVKMLVYQGAAAFERWTGVWPPTDIMEEAVLAGLRAKS
jgi:shikimate dehydrogenase